MSTTPSSRHMNSVFDDDKSIASSFTAYPCTKPYLNSSYRASPNKPVSTMPENERSGVMSALKNLQTKIRSLEMERSRAQADLNSMTSETDKYRQALERERTTKDSVTSQMSKHTQEVENQLQSAETRCNLLEKQLEYMRKMVENAERQRTEVLRVPEPVHKLTHDDIELKHQLDKISELEREHLKLTATQTLAENKLRELEDKLREERHQRKLIQERTAELQTAAEANRIMMGVGSPEVSQPVHSPRHTTTQKLMGKKKKKKATFKSQPLCKGRHVQPGQHYHLNLKDIPFVAGKSTGTTHSLGGNVQQMFALMKAHNPRLCNRGKPARPRPTTTYLGQRRESSSSTSTDSDLNELLANLQDEFGHLSFEHQDMLKQIDDADDYRLKEDLERELDVLVGRMEDKGAQIRKLKNLQEQMTKKKFKPKAKLKEPKQKRSSSTNGEVEVTTTIKTKGKTAHNIHVARPTSAQRPTSAKTGKLDLLKDVKRIQTTLRKDDISWD